MPAEPAVVELVRARSVTVENDGGPLFLSSAIADGQKTWTVARTDRGDCVFFGRTTGKLCAIHRDLGEEALPSACRHFPRRVLHDGRGTLISLSHFCPTAAAALLDGGTLSVVNAHAPLLLTSAMEGLDAREALPPLLLPGLLCDMAGYDAWERAAVDAFAHPENSYQQCLAKLARATGRAREWRPGMISLSDYVTAAFGETPFDRREHLPSDERLVERIAAMTANLTGGDVVGIPQFEEQWSRRIGKPGAWFDLGMKRYLAARVFGNWLAYQGRGLRSIVEWLLTCAAMVRYFALRRALESKQRFDERSFIEAVRSADLLLLHVLDSTAFARAIAPIEETDYA